jgi:hypothetical protein
VTTSDAICDSCRWKYIEWKRAMMGDFDSFEVMDNSVDINAEVVGMDGMVI